jgi:predicted nucleic acid-binding Zn ribbon protein
MALVKCPDCANAVSLSAKACTHCGAPIKKLMKKPRKHGAAWYCVQMIAGILIIVIAALIVRGIYLGVEAVQEDAKASSGHP